MPNSRSLVILGCSERKKPTAHLIAAVDRYDGPVFRVLRKHARDAAGTPPCAYILSGRFGLIPGSSLIPLYDHRIAHVDHEALSKCVDSQLKEAVAELKPDRIFVSVGRQYWSMLKEPLLREVEPEKLAIATGSIGGRASQLVHWLRPSETGQHKATTARVSGEVTLLGTTVRLSPAEVICKAREAFLYDPATARRFETWYVAVGSERVAPKWLVSIIFGKPVSRFRTADARRVLEQLGVETIYVS